MCIVREMGIGGENYERSIIPVRSDISRFSRGTAKISGSCSRHSMISASVYLLSLISLLIGI